MCKDCGCGQAAWPGFAKDPCHDPVHGHDVDPAHPHDGADPADHAYLHAHGIAHDHGLSADRSAGAAGPADGNAVRSSGTAVRSSGTAVRDAGTAVRDDGTAVRDDGTVVRSSGTVDRYAGTAVRNDGTVVNDERIAVNTDGTVGRHDVAVSRHDGTVVGNDSPVVRNDSPVVRNDGTVIPNDGSAVRSDGPVVRDDRAAAGPRTVTLQERVLDQNDRVAAQTRRYLAERGIAALNLISSPGAGKTLLLERTLEALRGELACAVIAGDQQTDRDAQRLAGKGAPVVQIETRNSCHLDAARVAAVLDRVLRPETRLLFIENVGNLVCPAAFDLGEQAKVALLSVTEGEDKPIKYPSLFAQAELVVLTKQDLVAHLDWQRDACLRYIRMIHPTVPVLELSARTGQGMHAWLQYCRQAVVTV